MKFKYFLTIISLILALYSFSNAEEIKLNNNNIFVKKGFSPEWIHDSPVNDKTWVVISSTRKEKSMRIMELPIPGNPKRSFFSFTHHKPEVFTFISSFDLKTQELGKLFLGLYIDQIAENWEIYLNGILIKSEMHLFPDGEIKVFRDQRRVLTYLNPILLKTGKNILAFKIYGDPSMIDTGFYTNKPIIIDDYEKLYKQKTRLIQLILLFVYLVAGLYVLLLYLFRRTELTNLIFALFSIMLFIYLLCRTSAIYSVFYNTKWSFLIEFISLYTLLLSTPV